MRSVQGSIRTTCSSTEGRRRLTVYGTVAGIGGSLVCSLSMVGTAIGIFATGGTTAAKVTSSSMAGMSGTGKGAVPSSTPAWLDVLIRFGPEILVTAIIILTIAVALRRSVAAAPALFGGAILYFGMYAQPDLAWMYASMVAGTGLLVLAYLMGMRAPRRWNRIPGW